MRNIATGLDPHLSPSRATIAPQSAARPPHGDKVKMDDAASRVQVHLSGPYLGSSPSQPLTMTGTTGVRTGCHVLRRGQIMVSSRVLSMIHY